MKRHWTFHATLSVTFALAVHTSFCNAYEAFVVYPGSRAMSMAGATGAQADDGTAIWYNPAGLKINRAIEKDFLINWGQQLHGTNDAFQSIGATNTHTGTSSINFASAYTDHISLGSFSLDNIGVGLVYFTPYSLTVYVNENSSLLTNEKYGNVNISYKQTSLLISRALNPALSVGATLDSLWTEYSCDENSLCTNKSATGDGVTLGFLYSLDNVLRNPIAFGITWRSKVDYSLSPGRSTGLATVLDRYTPDRPTSFSFAVNTHFDNAWSIIKSNIDIARTKWSVASIPFAEQSDYYSFATGVEILLKNPAFSNISLRFGARHANPNKQHYPQINSITLGMGLLFNQNQFIDAAIENRHVTWTGERDITLLSVSFTSQFLH